MSSDINEIKDWKQENKCLKRTIIFNDFKDALRAMNLIGEIAEKLNHHPNWSNCYNKLEIKLFTHTTGDITELDYLLASRINEVVSINFMI
jgi:4a-hydroxytetrahydrobiopterin dehydratase